MTEQEKERDIELLTIQNILKTENGRRFMYRCLENCNTFSNVYNNDHAIHVHDSGKRSHGLWLDGELREADEDFYYLMLKENR